MVVIIHESLRGSQFLDSLSFLKSHQLRYSSSIKPQMILECSPTPLAISIEFPRSDNCLEPALQHANEVQRGFRHCVAIIVSRDEKYWQSFNLALKGGTMRLHWVQEQAQCVELVSSLYQELSTPESQQKLKAQAEFFVSEKSLLRSEILASSVYTTALESLGISSKENISILCDGFPTLSKLVAADVRTLHESSPVSSEILNAISSFFHATADATELGVPAELEYANISSSSHPRVEHEAMQAQPAQYRGSVTYVQDNY